MFPARFAPILFGLFLSGIMSFIVSGLATWRAISFGGRFMGDWMSAWSFSWPIAFATVLVVAPLVRKFVARLVQKEDAA